MPGEPAIQVDWPRTQPIPRIGRYSVEQSLFGVYCVVNLDGGIVL